MFKKTPGSPHFVLPDVKQPCCSATDSWGRPILSRLARHAPFISPPIMTSPKNTSTGDLLSSEGSSAREEVNDTESDMAEDQEACDVETFSREENEECKIEPMTDVELEWVEWAHRKSKILEILAEPSLLFIAPPPYRFVTPIVTGNSVHADYVHKVLLEPKQRTISPGLKSEVESLLRDDSFVASLKGSSGPPSDFEVSKMDVLSEEIWHFHNSMTQSEEMLQRKFALRDMLYAAITPIFPMCGLYVVGSSLNGFGTDSSDMDLCLMITNKELDQKKDAIVVLNMIAYQLKNMGWIASQKLILAKVPILRIKFHAPYADITVDLNANNSVAIRNTHLLCYYSSFDWRVRPLVSVVKEWARRKGINDASSSSFTSYSLVLMVVHYLQCGLDEPVLPSLQRSYNQFFSAKNDVRILNIASKLPSPLEPFKANSTCCLSELLLGFLRYYASEFDYDKYVISVRQGKKVDRMQFLTKKDRNSHTTKMWRAQWKCVCIEEPFTSMNTAHSVYDEITFIAIQKAFGEGFNMLEETRDLNRLFSCAAIDSSHLGPQGYATVIEPQAVQQVSLPLTYPAPNGYYRSTGGTGNSQRSSSDMSTAPGSSSSSSGNSSNSEETEDRDRSNRPNTPFDHNSHHMSGRSTANHQFQQRRDRRSHVPPIF